MAILLGGTALSGVAPVMAQNAGQAAPAQAKRFDIPAQPLTEAIMVFGRQSGIQVTAEGTLVSGQRSAPVKGNLTPTEALSRMLNGTDLSWRWLGADAVQLEKRVNAGNAVQLGTIRVEGASGGAGLAGVAGESGEGLPAYVTAFGGRSVADTGTTVLSAEGYRARTIGNGDANTVLRAMPNVQYQNDTSTDAGYDGMREIDMRPLEVSISGARVYENNFRINGVGVNNLTGRAENPGLANFCGEISHDYCTAHDQTVVYGLHSQTVFVPEDFVESVRIVDSNASARYGDFQGGVVDYVLAEPKSQFSGTFNYSHSGSDWVEYRLGTQNGQNPYNRLKPYFKNDRYALSLNVPVRENWDMSFSVSQQDAHSRKQRDAQYINDAVIEDESTSRFYRVASKHRTGFGTFMLDASYTDYTNSFINVGYLDTVFDVKSRGLTSQLRHEIDLGGVSWERIGLGNLRLTSRIFYNDSYV
ncbi:MAG: STN domain-containing protein, partial [Asticcacaulis sp.]